MRRLPTSWTDLHLSALRVAGGSFRYHCGCLIPVACDKNGQWIRGGCFPDLLRLPWESGFFREVTEADRPMVASTESLEESVQRKRVATTPLPQLEAIEQPHNDEDGDLEKVWFDPIAATRVQERAERHERKALVTEFMGWVMDSQIPSVLRKQLGETESLDDKLQIVDDATMERSTSTLKVRIGRLRRLSASIGMSPLDCSEEPP